MKTPFDFLARLAPKATPEEEAAARELGVDVHTYRAAKLEVVVKQAAQAQHEKSGVPDDIAAETAKALHLRREPGLVKLRHTSPNLLVQAAKTPGEVAQLILFVLLYVIGLAALVIIGGERVHRMPGIFQVIILGLMVIPTLWLSRRIWEAIGERARDLFRFMIRFWPLTLFLLVFALALLKALQQRLAN
jgi:hypothetical protein